MNRDRLKATLKRHEGVRQTAYRDSRDIWTIGVGHNMEVDPHFAETVRLLDGDVTYHFALTVPEIDRILEQDINRAVVAAIRIFTLFETYSDSQQESLVNMVFNLGERGVSSFTNMVRCIHEGNWSLAAIEGLDSKWHREDVGHRAVEVVKGFLT